MLINEEKKKEMMTVLRNNNLLVKQFHLTQHPISLQEICQLSKISLNMKAIIEEKKT